MWESYILAVSQCRNVDASRLGRWTGMLGAREQRLGQQQPTDSPPLTLALLTQATMCGTVTLKRSVDVPRAGCACVDTHDSHSVQAVHRTLQFDGST